MGLEVILGWSQEETAVELLESHTHSFIAKIWLEEKEADRALWRGHITHVLSGERRYFQSVDDITAFVISYLVRISVEPPTCNKVMRWLNRLKLCLRL
jgi:hypothetical protein